MTEKRINLEKELKWYTDTEDANSGIINATGFKAFLNLKTRYYKIIVYPLRLKDGNKVGWDYKITKLTKNGKIIKEYDAGAKRSVHFSNEELAKIASITKLREMLGDY